MNVWARPAHELWWLHPLACVAGVAAVYAGFAAFDFERFVPNAYIPGGHYAWGAALLATLAIGIGTTTAGRRWIAPGESGAGFDIPAWAMASVLGATLAGYAVWFGPVVVNPQLLIGIVAGERANLREVIETTPGVTTMTQFGIAYVIAHAIVAGSRSRRLALWEHAGLAAVLLLGVVRSVAWSERLAVIELVVTWTVARLAFLPLRIGTPWTLATLLPLVAPLLLWAGFTGTEYFRSWHFYRNEYDSIWAFTAERLTAYYALASNNGIGLLVENSRWPQYTGRFVAEWLYLMPVLGDTLRQVIGDVQPEYIHFLQQHARIEFNNPSGLFPIVFDIGYAGSAVYFLVVGAIVGAWWDGWRRHALAGLLFYPLAVLFLIELLRFNYFASTRVFPVALALCFYWLAARPAWPRFALRAPAAPIGPLSPIAPNANSRLEPTWH